MIISNDFWQVNEEKILEQLKKIKKGRVEKIGTSASRKDLYGVVYNPDLFSHVFAVIGGMHGHEPGGVASAFNIISILEKGKDLKNKKFDNLFNKIKFVIIPVLNPDARSRCPDSFVGLTSNDVEVYANGLNLQRRFIKRKKVINTKNAFIIGGLYNDNGVDIFNYDKKDYKNCPEIAYTIDFFLKEKVEYFINLHAHSFNIMFYSPHKHLKKDDLKKELYITRKVREKGIKAGYHFPKTEYEMNPDDKNMVEIPCDILIHNTTGAMPFLIECPQGTINTYKCFYGGKEREIKDPGYSHEKIVDSYIFVIQEINRLLLRMCEEKFNEKDCLSG